MGEASQGMYVDVVAVLATTSALDCARRRPSLSSPPEEEVMTGAMCAPGATVSASSARSEALGELILFIEFLKKALRERVRVGWGGAGAEWRGEGTVKVVRGVVVLWWIYTADLRMTMVGN
jgi:hypothetical protein